MVLRKHFPLLLLVCVLSLAVLGWKMGPLQQPPAAPIPPTNPNDGQANTEPGSAPPQSPPHWTDAKPPVVTPSTRPAAAVSTPSSRSTSQTPVPKIIGALEEIATSYDAARVPELVPYLYSETSEIRAAAAEALVTLGAASGAEALEQAARFITDPQEADSMRKKAAFLNLPSGKLSPMRKNQLPPSPQTRQIHPTNSAATPSSPRKSD